MARIIIFTHEYDQFLSRRRFWQKPSSVYLLFNVLKNIERRGHDWRIAAGPKFLAGDVAWLHVDATFIDPAYLAMAAHYPKTINFGTKDISKRKVGGALLAEGDNWAGPVIIKSDLNYMGHPELHHNERAKRAGRPVPHPGSPAVDGYIVLPSIAHVEDSVWRDAAKVVERFVPEPDKQGYALRTWVFLGKSERCSRHVAADPMVKADRSISRTAVPIPQALRAERARLGFDYGKFDFVMHEGAPILLDANRTPGSPPAVGSAEGGSLQARAELLTDGLEDFLRGTG